METSTIADERIKNRCLNIIADELEASNLKKYTCVNGFGYSQVERNIVDRIIEESQRELKELNKELLEMLGELINAGQEALDYSDGSGKPILQEAIWKAKSLINES